MLNNLTRQIYYTNRLSFGVPLEDVFPSGEIHPGLKNLLQESYKNIVKDCHSVEEVLSRFQGALHERLKLKERLVICKEFEGLKTSPGALLWVARHFIGLLPIPLMPQYSNGQTFLWLELSKECKISLADYATRGRSNRKLVKKLVQELLRLPPPHFLLAATLLDFLRKLSVLPGGEPKINKSAIFALVKYFSSSVFLRPFRPGWVKKEDKQYFPLLLYLILKWPEIRRICVETSNYSFALPLEEIYPGYHGKLLLSEYPLYLSKRARNNATQTAAHMQIKPEEKKTLVRIVPPSYDDFSFLRDTACQTENFDSDYENLSKQRVLGDKKENVLKRQVIFIRKDCCCTYSTNYEMNEPMQNESKQFDSENYINDSPPAYTSDFEIVRPDTYSWRLNETVDTNCSTPTAYGWNINEIPDTNRSNKSEDATSLIYSPISEFIDSANYSYDDYSKCNLICDTQNLTQSHENIKKLDPIEKDEKHCHNEAIKEKISKMGWTYTSPCDDKMTPIENIKVSSSTSYNTPQQDCYKLYYDVRKSLNEELKEKLDKLKISEKYDKEISTDNEDLAGSNSKLHLSDKINESKKSLINVNKIKSKLDFLRIFNAKKEKAKKSFSFEQVGSRVKYEKMGSASSIL